MNERLPYSNMRKVALLARENNARQKRLLSETDQLLRGSRLLINRTQEHLKPLSRILSCIRYQHNDDHEDRKDDDVSATADSKKRNGAA
jgi:hypothetical protein